MKPKSVDDGSLEKLAKKAATAFKSKTGLIVNAVEFEYLEQAFLSALSEATAALEEKIKELQIHEEQTHLILGRILGTTDSLEQMAKQAVARIKELESANATTPTPVLKVSAQTGTAL